MLDPSPGNVFLQELRQFQAPIARAGMWNSIAQLVLKIASPGVPDFYQGNDLWAFDLVDPDNRRAVNYDVRRQMLKSLQEQAERDRAALVDRLRENPCDGAIKLYVTSEALRFRRDHRDLFAQGSYTALAAEGNRARHAVAFCARDSRIKRWSRSPAASSSNCATRTASPSETCGATPPSRFPRRSNT